MSERMSETRNVAAWPCDVCGEERPSYLVQITRHDVSHQVGLDAGTLAYTVRHCCDRRACVEAAEDPDNWRIVTEARDAWEELDVGLQLVTGSGE